MGSVLDMCRASTLCGDYVTVQTVEEGKVFLYKSCSR